MATDSERAVAAFKEGFNCAQSVASCFAPQFGLDRETALKAAQGFGGGMGRMGGVCGAVTGAFLVLGLRYGGTDPKDPATKQKVIDLVQEFARRFEKRYGSIVCRTLIDCDISTPEGFQRAREKGVFADLCPKLVGGAAEILEGMLQG